MITRRTALAGAGMLAATAAAAQGKRPWAAQVPVIRIGLLGGENDADRLKRYGPYQKLMEDQFGVPAKMLTAADYAGVIQAFAAGQIEVAYMSPAAYAAAWIQSDGNVVPLVTAVEKDGSTSYVSVMYVRADSGITDLAGMKGKSLAWADPNSASGYLIPRSEFRAQGLDPATYFSRTGFAGGHEQAVVAVLGRQYDGGVTWTSGVGDPADGYTRGNLRIMVEKKMLDMKDIRMIWKSRPIENGPLTVRKDTPQSFQDDMRDLHVNLSKNHPDVFEAVNMGSGPTLVPVTHADYQPFIDMLKAEASERRPAAVSATVEAAFQARRRRRAQGWALWLAALVPALLVSAWVSEVSPAALWAGLPRAGVYFAKMVPDLRWPLLFAGPDVDGSFAGWFYRLDQWAWLLFETSQMAALATFGGALVALMLCFPAAANLAPNRPTYLLFRRGLELFRTVPDIVYALILVWAVGVGPLAGIVAIMLHTIGALGKLFAEVVENADMRPLEGIEAAGGSWWQGVRYAILPQVLPNFLSYTLLRFEVNVRGATVIGFVGAGGIGQELYTVISFNYYTEISAILVLIVLTVSVIDLVSERLRARVIAE